MPSNIAVGITVDVADLTAKRAVMSAELKAAQRDLRQFAETARTSGMTDELRASMLATGAEVAKASAQIKALTAEMKAASAESGGFGSAMKEVRAATAEMNEGLLGLHESIAGLAASIAGAFAVEEVKRFFEGLAEGAEQVQHAAVTFGLTTDQVQALKAEAAGLGVPFEAFTTAMQRADRALTTAREGNKQTGNAFRELGIDISKPIDNATLLQQAIAGLATVQDVPTRIGLAMQIFGKNVQNLGPLIGATKEQIEDIQQSTEKFGAVNATAQASGMLLAEAFNRQKIEMMGLSNTLVAELGPGVAHLIDSITGALESFREWAGTGDNLKTALDDIKIAAVSLAAAIGAGMLTGAIAGVIGLAAPFVEALTLATGATELLTAAQIGLDAAMDANPVGLVVLAIEALAAALAALTIVLMDAYENNETFKESVDHGVAIVRAWADQFVQIGKVLVDTVLLVADVARAINDLNTLNLADLKATVVDMRQKWADLDKAGNQYVADASGVQGAMDAITAKARDQASAMGVLVGQMGAFEATARQIATGFGTMFSPVATPPVKLAGGGGGSKGGGSKKDTEVADDEKELQHLEVWQRVAAQIAGITADMDQLEVDFWAKKLATATKGSDDWFAIMAKEQAAIAKQTNDAVREITEGVDREIAEHRRAVEEQQRNSDELARIIQHEVDQEVEAHKQGLEREKQAYAEFKSVVGPVVSSFTNGLLQMAEGAQSFAQMMRSIGQQILSDFVSRVIDPMIEKWAWSQAEKVLTGQQAQAILRALGLADLAQQVLVDTGKTASTTTNATAQTAALGAAAAAQKLIAIAQVPAFAGLAGAGGIASMAAAPFPIDLGAPAFGASMAAAAGAFGSLVSAAGGFDIPAGLNPMAQLHAQEMVLPARIANPLRDSLAAGGGPWGAVGQGSGDGGASGAPVAVNLNITTMDGPSVLNHLRQNKGALQTVIQEIVRGRNGKGFGYSQ